MIVYVPLLYSCVFYPIFNFKNCSFPCIFSLSVEIVFKIVLMNPGDPHGARRSSALTNWLEQKGWESEQGRTLVDQCDGSRAHLDPSLWEARESRPMDTWYGVMFVKFRYTGSNVFRQI